MPVLVFRRDGLESSGTWTRRTAVAAAGGTSPRQAQAGIVWPMTDGPARLSYRAGMRKLEQYRRNMELCLANAAKAPFDELRAVWQTLGDSYAFLVELELEPGRAPISGNARAVHSALSADRLNGHSSADRILP